MATTVEGPATGGADPPLTGAQIAEIRRWARAVASNGGDTTLREAAAAVVRLADEAARLRAPRDGDAWDWQDDPPGEEVAGVDLSALRALATDTALGGSVEHAAAARAIRLLAQDVEGLQGAPVSPPPSDLVATGFAGRLHPLAIAGAIAPVIVLALLALGLRASAPDLDASGPADHAVLNRADARSLELAVAGDASTLARLRWVVDGHDATGDTRIAGGRSILRPRLGDGNHEVVARLGGSVPWSSAKTTWRFAIDATPPAIELPGDVLKAQVRTPFELHGSVSGAVRLTVDGRDVVLADDGTFALSTDEPPVKPLELIARDEAGNVSRRAVSVVLMPRRPSNRIRAVHVSADGWANDELRSAVLRLIDEKRINAVELDLKDESGVIGWDAPVALGKEIGAVQQIFDLGAAVEMLHARGVRVIGRLVAFRDPILSEAAWRAGRKEQVIQTPGGKPYSGGYGGFTSFANPAVRQYNIDVAVAAAALGVDDILYDYVRRPDGPLASMKIPGLKGDASRSIVSFLADTRAALEPETFLGASVFGIAASRPGEIAQDVPAMARQLDYVAPMVYPSHWAPYEYGIANPNAQPYDIVRASLEDFRSVVDGTGAQVVPWLQDFSLGVDYGPAEVKAQIQAAKDAGLPWFLLWDPTVTYTTAAIAPVAKLPATGEKPAPAPAPAYSLAPNEIGVVPVLMHHQLLADGGSEYDLTPTEFRRELDRLWREGYRPIRVSDLVEGTIGVPEGTTPVAMTFDDGTASQAALTEDGRIDPGTAVGIMLEFAKTHPGFEPAGTFYVNREPFGAGERTAELMRKLVSFGFEFGNHTQDHANLGELDDDGVQQQLVLGNRVIRAQLPDAEITTMALPLGVLPQRPELAVSGAWDGEEYRFDAVLLVGAEPSPSPFATSFDPRGAGVPRIRSTPDRSVENGSADWLDRLAREPERRYVADGDSQRITVPDGQEAAVAERYLSRVG
jgi:hypothetical protein